jgi:hypothetical protein
VTSTPVQALDPASRISRATRLRFIGTSSACACGEPCVHGTLVDLFDLFEQHRIGARCMRSAAPIVSVSSPRSLALLSNADVLTVDGVTVHPLQFAALTADPRIREFQIVQHADRLTLRLVPNGVSAADDLSTRLPRQLTSALRDIGVRRPDVDVELRETIE